MKLKKLKLNMMAMVVMKVGREGLRTWMREAEAEVRVAIRAGASAGRARPEVMVSRSPTILRLQPSTSDRPLILQHRTHVSTTRHTCTCAVKCKTYRCAAAGKAALTKE